MTLTHKGRGFGLFFFLSGPVTNSTQLSIIGMRRKFEIQLMGQMVALSSILLERDHTTETNHFLLVAQVGNRSEYFDYFTSPNFYRETQALPDNELELDDQNLMIALEIAVQYGSLGEYPTLKAFINANENKAYTRELEAVADWEGCKLLKSKLNFIGFSDMDDLYSEIREYMETNYDD